MIFSNGALHKLRRKKKKQKKKNKAAIFFFCIWVRSSSGDFASSWEIQQVAIGIKAVTFSDYGIELTF